MKVSRLLGLTAWASVLTCSVACSEASNRGGSCTPEDADGVIGGDYTFLLTVDDAGYKPSILRAQNTSTVNIELENAGTDLRGFRIACLSTPNSDGCSTESCFPDAAEIAPIEPGSRATVQFEVPRVEGIYAFRSGVPTDPWSGQFIVQ